MQRDRLQLRQNVATPTFAEFPVVPEVQIAPPGARPYPDDDRYPSGWFTHEECDLLAEWAQDKLILELGTYLGRSTVAMARTARHVVTVDHFQGSPLENWYEPGDYLSQTRANLKRYGVERKVTVIATDTRNLVGWLRGGSFDGVLVDGAHDGLSVQNDTGVAFGVVRRLDGVLWDDYSPYWPDVIRIVDAMAKANGVRVSRLAPGSSLVRLV